MSHDCDTVAAEIQFVFINSHKQGGDNSEELFYRGCELFVILKTCAACEYTLHPYVRLCFRRQ